MNYDLFLHRHNYACWAAARAAQRGLKNGNVSTLQEALEDSGVKDHFDNTDHSFRVKADHYRDAHSAWCNKIIKYFEKKTGSKMSFGRAAKLVAIYLKTMVICDTNHDPETASIIYPPIDGILLKNLSKIKSLPETFEKKELQVAWTRMNEEQYYKTLDAIKEILNNNLKTDCFWEIERHWNNEKSTPEI